MSHYSGIYTIYWTRRTYYIFLVRYNGREQLDAMEIRWKPYRECPFLLTVGAGRFVKFGRNIWVKIRPSCMYIHVSGSDIWVIQIPKRLCCLCTLRQYAQPSIHKFLKLHHEICIHVYTELCQLIVTVSLPPPPPPSLTFRTHVVIYTHAIFSVLFLVWNNSFHIFEPTTSENFTIYL